MLRQDKILFQFNLFRVPVRVRAVVLFNLMFLITYPPSLMGSLLALVSVLLIIVFHLLGHALTCRLLGYRVDGLDAVLAGGTIEHATCDRERDDILIAWGGVFGQIFLFALVFGACRLLSDSASAWSFIAAVFFEIFAFDTIFTIVYNLLPFPGLDGALAWRFISRRGRAGGGGRFFDAAHRNVTPRPRVLSFKKAKKRADSRRVSAEARAFADKVFDDMMKKQRGKDDPDRTP